MPFEVHVEQVDGLSWKWRVTQGRDTRSWGLGQSEVAARTEADQSVAQHRRRAEADRIWGAVCKAGMAICVLVIVGLFVFSAQLPMAP